MIKGMNQANLYAILARSQCSVLLFEDHPNFFGNWRVLFECKKQIFEVVSDHREGWLALWHHSKDGQRQSIFESDSRMLDEADELAMLETWLANLAC